MEKIIYALWQHAGASADDFRDMLLADLAPRLGELAEVCGLRLAVSDSDVSAAAARRMESHSPLPNALVSLWVESADEVKLWEPLIDDCIERRSGYVVVETEPLVSQQRHSSALGERVFGMCQVAFLRKPADLNRDEWLAIWQGSHTQIAIDTQSTFGYRQNAVQRALDENSLPFDAIVEENFPPGAMASDHAFYDTDGDASLLEQRMTVMLESCARFIDFEHIDVIPMSEYVIKRPAAP